MKYEYLKASVDRLNYKPGMFVSVVSNSDNMGFNWFEDIPSLLDEFGKDGWELVHFERDSKLGNDWEMFFKRSVSSGPDEYSETHANAVELLKRTHAMLSNSIVAQGRTRSLYNRLTKLYQDIADYLQIAEVTKAIKDNDIEED